MVDSLIVFIMGNDVTEASNVDVETDVVSKVLDYYVLIRATLELQIVVVLDILDNVKGVVAVSMEKVDGVRIVNSKQSNLVREEAL